MLFRSDVRVAALLVALPEMHPPTADSTVAVIRLPIKESVANSLARNKCLVGAQAAGATRDRFPFPVKLSFPCDAPAPTGTRVAECGAPETPQYVLVQLPDDGSSEDSPAASSTPPPEAGACAGAAPAAPVPAPAPEDGIELVDATSGAAGPVAGGQGEGGLHSSLPPPSVDNEALSGEGDFEGYRSHNVS